jgi:predicted dehydrogenase
VVSAQVRGGMTRGQEFLLEIHGSEGDLMLAATGRGSTQRQELTVHGARGAASLTSMPVPAKYRWVPETVPVGSPYNVAQLYAKLGEAIRGGKAAYPGFDAAIERHAMLDMINQAAATGQKQSSRLP